MAEVIGGFISQGVAGELLSFADHRQELPTAADIVADPIAAKLPKRADLAYAAQLTAINAGLQGGDLDRVWKYVQRLPAEYHISAVSRWANDKRTTGRIGLAKSLVQYIIKHNPEVMEIVGAAS